MPGVGCGCGRAGGCVNPLCPPPPKRIAKARNDRSKTNRWSSGTRSGIPGWCYVISTYAPAYTRGHTLQPSLHAASSFTLSFHPLISYLPPSKCSHPSVALSFNTSSFTYGMKSLSAFPCTEPEQPVPSRTPCYTTRSSICRGTQILFVTVTYTYIGSLLFKWRKCAYYVLFSCVYFLDI